MKIAMGGDFHFRSKAPEARLDNYLETQDKLISWMRDQFPGYRWLCSGDLLHLARERAEPLSWVYYLLNVLPEFWGVRGNHDLLYHSLNELHRSSIGLLEMAGKFHPLSVSPIIEDDVEIYGYDFGTEIQHVKPKKTKTLIAVYHGMVLKEANPFYSGLVAKNILTEFPEYDIILTGDNHEGFVEAVDDRVLINPGAFKRDNADMIDVQPYVYTFDTEMKTVERVAVPIQDDIISRDHIELEKERDKRMEELADKFPEMRNTTLNFQENLYEFITENGPKAEVEHTILEWLE